MTKKNNQLIEKAYEIAQEQYAEIDIETAAVLKILESVPVSIHCWQGDDVGGFEKPDAALSGGGIQVTGNYPGKARTVAELRMDFEKVLSLIPGSNRLNLHAIYGEFGGKLIDRDQIEAAHFQGWIDWAKKVGIKLDFNSTCFSHPKADDGYTLSHKDKSIRDFWIEHVQRCREISAFFGRELNDVTIHDIWIPDGSKDELVDRFVHRSLLKDSLDKIFQKEYNPGEMKDALESKLFGIGSESFVVGSHDFYLGYAAANNKIVCLDNGHFHPTESVADKVSSVLQFTDEVLLHITRGVRWDSDHVVTLNDQVTAIMHEIVRANALDRVHLALDFFDASINRIGAWVVGTRAVQKALLFALLEPVEKLRQYENNGQYFERLALLEELKTKPFGAVWDYYCLQQGIIPGEDYISEIQSYERDVTSKRK
ncbi:MAG: L-rhamnose isomerase [Calditrichaeota bacterium]|nr:L-rhamnose isomerase [Calditrichota bacterium]